MKRNLLYKIAPAVIGCIVLMSYSNQAPPEGHTGSPGDAKSCATAGCHGSSTVAGSNMITHDIPAEGYEPGKEYNITVTVAKNGSSKFGYQLSPQKADGTQVGTLTAGTGSQVSSSGKYIGHAGGQTAGTNTRSWSFKWTAPSANTGTFSFYVAGNASNSNGMTSGDEIQVASEEVTEKGVETGIQQVKKFEGFRFYPNPVTDFIRVESEQVGAIKITTTSGQVIERFKVDAGNNSFNLSSLQNGIYLITYEIEGEEKSNQTLIKF